MRSDDTGVSTREFAKTWRVVDWMEGFADFKLAFYVYEVLFMSAE